MKTSYFKKLKNKENYTVNKEKTKEFYEKYEYLCNCLECMNYYKKIQVTYPKLVDFLNEYNVDIEKPVEIITYDYENNKQVCESYYVVIGDLIKEFSLQIDDLFIEFIDKQNLFKVETGDDYFLINIKGIHLERGIYFVSNNERKGSNYFEFQFCKIKDPIKKTIFGKYRIKGYKMRGDDSIYLDSESFDYMIEKYDNYIRLDNNSHERFAYYGENYYDKDCALELLQSIKSINDSELSVLISFLEEDIEKYNGFYLLGI